MVKITESEKSDKNELEDMIKEVINESLLEGTPTAETKSNQYELDVTSAIKNFLSKQKSPYNELSVSHYEGSDSKYWSDISITNPKTNERVWVEAKENKYACLGGQSFKYEDGKWSCSTTEDGDTLGLFITQILEENSKKFVEFCKSYLKKDDIKLPSEITKDLIEAWKENGSVDDTDNDVQFITNKVEIEDFGGKIAQFYKNSKNEPVYYMHVGDDLYLIDKDTNIFRFKTKNGGNLKTLSEAYRIGRIQFRAKGYDRPQKYYFSIYSDLKILSDKENQDTDYSCSFLGENKWPVICDDENNGDYLKKDDLVAGDENDDIEEIEEAVMNVLREENSREYNLSRPTVRYRCDEEIFNVCARRLMEDSKSQKNKSKGIIECMNEEDTAYLVDSPIKTYPTQKFLEKLVKKFYRSLKLDGNVAYVDSDDDYFEFDGKNIIEYDQDIEDKFPFQVYQRNSENGVAGTLEFSFSIQSDKRELIDNEKFMSELVNECHYCGYDIVNYMVKENGNMVEFHYLFESKYQKNDIEIRDRLYHISPLRNKDKILSKGIFPRSESFNDGLKLKHELRVYLFNGYNEELFKMYIRKSGKKNSTYSDDVSLNGKYGIFEIDKNKIGNIQLYRDNMFMSSDTRKPTALYTYEMIPPSSIRLIKTLDVEVEDSQNVVFENENGMKNMRMEFKGNGLDNDFIKEITRQIVDSLRGEIFKIRVFDENGKEITRYGKGYNDINARCEISEDKLTYEFEYDSNIMDDDIIGQMCDDLKERNENVSFNNEDELESQILDILEEDSVEENLTIPQNKEDKVESELYRKLEKNYDHSDRIIRWYRNEKKNGTEEKELKKIFVDNLDNIKDLLKTYDGYIQSLKKMKMLNKKVELNGKQFDVVKDLDKIRRLSGFQSLVKAIGDEIHSGTTIDTTNEKYAITESDRKKIRLLGFTENVMCWCTEEYETTNKFIYHLWQNSKTLGRGDVYGDKSEQTPYCTHSKEHWNDYSEGVERYQQFWYLERFDNRMNVSYDVMLSKNRGDVSSQDEIKVKDEEFKEKLKGLKFKTGDLNDVEVVKIFNMMKGCGSSLIIAMNDSNDDFLDSTDDKFDDFKELNHGKEVEELHKNLFEKESKNKKVNLGGKEFELERKHRYLRFMGDENAQDEDSVFVGDFIPDEWNADEGIPISEDLTTLKGLPKKMKGFIQIQNAVNLKSLEGMPIELTGNIYMRNCGIETLEHLPKLTPYPSSDNTPRITFRDTKIKNLIGAESVPEEYKMYISGSELTSLEGCPKKIKELDLSNCDKLPSLKGISKEIKELIMNGCDSLESLDYAPEFLWKVQMFPTDKIHKEDIEEYKSYIYCDDTIVELERKIKNPDNEEVKEKSTNLRYKMRIWHEIHTMPNERGYRQRGPKWKELPNLTIEELSNMLDEVNSKKNGVDEELESQILDVLEENDDYKLLTNLAKENIQTALETLKTDNVRYNKAQFDKLFGNDTVNWCALVNKDEYLSIAAVLDDYPERGIYFINEIQRIKKGYGSVLIHELVNKYKKIWLMKDISSSEDLLEYYRRKEFKFSEYVVPNSTYGCPLHFFYTKNIDEDKLREYIDLNYDEEKSKSDVNEELEQQINEILSEDSVEDIISDMKKVRSTNEENPDRKRIMNNTKSKTLTLIDSLDGRLQLVDQDGYAMRRDDGGEMYFDDEEYVKKWTSERGYELDESIEMEGLMEQNEEKNSRIAIGLIIKNTKNHFLDNILSGKKTIETRYEVPFKRILNKCGGLKNFIGSHVALIDDKQQIVGTAFVTNVIKYETKQEFAQDFDKHMVDADDSEYGWKDGKIKYGIELNDIKTDGYPKKINYNSRYQNQNDRLNGFLFNDELLNIKEAEKDIGGEKSETSDEVQGLKIWIDDIREAPEGFKWFKTTRDFIDYISTYGTKDIELIDTDHDAGDYQKFGGDYIRCFDYLDYIGAKNITIHIHSANPVGANNIRQIISKNKEENNWKEIRNTNK